MKFWIAFLLSFLLQLIALILTLYGDIIFTPIFFFVALFIISIWGIVNYND